MKKIQIYIYANRSGHADDVIEEETVEQKNWRHLFLFLGETKYHVYACAPLRYAQTVEIEIEEREFYIADPSEFIVKDVSKETIIKIVPLLIKEGFLERLKEMSNDEVEQLDLTLMAEIDLV